MGRRGLTGRSTRVSTFAPALPRPRAPQPPFTRSHALSPAALQSLPDGDPFLAYDLSVVADRVRAFLAAFRSRVGVHYAVKCNPDTQVLATVASSGGGFEIASLGELRLATAAGAAATDVLYSNPVKPPAHIAAAAAAGVRLFSVDSPEELEKIARYAPGAGIYVRLRVDDTSSRFPLSAKFGTSHAQAFTMLTGAASLGLLPAGLTFHVGSQCTDRDAWARAVELCGPLLHDLRRAGVRLSLLDIGGGFPARYAGEESLPTLTDIADRVLRAIDGLPYQPEHVVCEPGRAIAAESAVLGATVIGRAVRDGRTWIYTDVGAYNGLMEAAQTGGALAFPVATARGARPEPATVMRCTVTGPSCDSSDTLLRDAQLPADIEVGDRLLFASAGAYSLCYASPFNGFAIPESVYVA